MKRVLFVLVLAASLVGIPTLGTLVEAHPGNVRRSDCTHVDRKTGNRHRHTGRPYCNQLQFLSPAWMHH